jgi:hypothetical protein
VSLGNVPRVVPASYRKPLWLFPNLLSLDAPLVAMAWLYVFAKTWRLGYHPWEAYASLGLAVWIIYVADRLLDASLAGGTKVALEPRHRFHVENQRYFRIALVIAGLTAVALVVLKMPMATYKYLLLGGVMVAGFFGLSMLSSQDPDDVPHTKNIFAGITFAFGTAMTAHLYRYEYDIYDMLASREFVCFAVLCILNISAIDLWEHASRSADAETKATDELALTLPLIVLAAAALMYALLDEGRSSRPFFYAILTGAGLLYVLNRERANFRMDSLRVMADIVLLIPVLVFLVASRPDFQ